MRHNLSSTSKGFAFVFAIALALGATQCTSGSAPNDNSRQLAALQKACDAGVLSQQECEQHRAQLASQSSSGASRPSSARARSANSSPDIFRDPAGHYSLSLPDGWNTIVNNGKVQFSSGDNWVTLFWDDISEDTSGSLPNKVSHQIVEDTRNQFTKLEFVSEGDIQVNGHPAHGITADGVTRKGRSVSVTVMSIGGGGGHILSVVTSSPRDQANEFAGVVMDMAQSIRFTGK